MELTALRAQMDAIDRRLIEAFQERMTLAAAIGQYKKEHGLPILQPEREAETLCKLERSVPETLRPELRTLYALLFALSRAEQERA